METHMADFSCLASFEARFRKRVEMQVTKSMTIGYHYLPKKLLILLTEVTVLLFLPHRVSWPEGCFRRCVCVFFGRRPRAVQF